MEFNEGKHLSTVSLPELVANYIMYNKKLFLSAAGKSLENRSQIASLVPKLLLARTVLKLHLPPLIVEHLTTVTNVIVQHGEPSSTFCMPGAVTESGT